MVGFLLSTLSHLSSSVVNPGKCGTGYNSRYKVTLRFTQIAPAGGNFLYPRHVRRKSGGKYSQEDRIMTNQESTVGKEELEGKLIFRSIFFFALIKSARLFQSSLTP